MHLMDYEASASLNGGSAVIFFIAIFALVIVPMWKIFTKAGQPGWYSLIPILNTIILLKIAGKPGWWILILWLFIPAILMIVGLAKNFGKGGGFAMGLLFLGFIFYPILAFGPATYQPQPT